jgi:pimeloyl-ACP methyl ester carboxylesterase
MAYWQWGDAQAEHTVVCVHGLARQGRDFDVLAQALVARSKAPLRVICPDVVGRGRSDWLADPQGYQIPAYASDMLTLLGHLQPKTLDWLGTSMGGLIGLCVAAFAPTLGLNVRRLVLNDVGPVIQWESLVRIGTYLGEPVCFDTLQDAADALLAISTTFGPHTPEQWLALTRHMVRPLANGEIGLTMHYDPAIAIPFREVTREICEQGEAEVWKLYEGLQAQTLLLRGADSDLLSLATAQRMTQCGPRAQLVEFAGVGHAPTLIADDQVQAVCEFLLA